MNGKRMIAILVALMITLQLGFLSSAQNNTGTASTGFSDLKEGHWAYKAVMWMVGKNIISGYPDNTFKPDKVISRAEFSSIMVLALNLPKKTPEKETFIDIKKDNWAFTYVESAKYYLTGFRTKEGDKFWPGREAVREDMAVALVKAKGYQNEEIDESILDEFIDKDSISSNLRKYVAIAVKHGIMKGNPAPDGNMKVFRPQNFLTRAEAAALIYSSLQQEEEKVTYDEAGSLPENNEEQGSPDMNEGGSIYEYPMPVVQGSVANGKVTLSWSKAAESNFKYYKVVISKGNPSPRYPQDGYLYCITDRYQTSTVIDSTHYNGGDVSGGLVPGQKYYFSVTAVYEDANVPGNAVSLVYPQEAQAVSGYPKIYGKVENGKIKLNWDAASEYGFTYYKVVISKYNSAPKYPEDGYLCYITDRSKTYAIVDNNQAYNNGDFGKYLSPGQKYYFRITYVYKDRKVHTNTITLTYPGSTSGETQATSLRVTGKVENGKVVLNWNALSKEGFKYYKVVISKDDPNPVYPEDGYLYYISDASTTYAVVDNSKAYKGGSLGEYLIPGQKYYFSITAVYYDKKVQGNAVSLTFP